MKRFDTQLPQRHRPPERMGVVNVLTWVNATGVCTRHRRPGSGLGRTGARAGCAGATRSESRQMNTKEQASPAAAGLGRAEILSIAGTIDDAKVAAIEASGATAEQLEEAVAWAAGLSGVMSKERRPLSGLVAQLHEILTADEDFDDERD